MSRYAYALACATGMVLGGQSFSIPQALAQDASPSAPASSSADKPKFQSHGISASISSLTVGGDQGDTIAIQFVITNQGHTPIGIAAITGEVTTASTTNGETYTIRTDTTGIQGCRATAVRDIAECLSTFDKIGFTEAPPEQPVIALLYFRRNGRGDPPTGTFSFSLRLMVRELPSDDSSLSAAPTPKGAGAAHLVTINFPLIPLKSD